MGKHRQDPVTCTMCNGDGYIEKSQEGDGGPKVIRVRCDACNGTGTQP